MRKLTCLRVVWIAVGIIWTTAGVMFLVGMGERPRQWSIDKEIERYSEDMLTGDYNCVVHGPVTQTLWVANLPRCQKCVSAAFPPLKKVSRL